TPAGKGQAVILVPGLGAHGLTLTNLHVLGAIKGYKTVDWGGGINRGSAKANIEELKELVISENDKTGMPVAFVGHSFGGIIGKQAANDVLQELAEEQRIYQIVTLGSPLNPDLAKKDHEGVNGAVFKVFQAFNPEDDPRVIEARRVRVHLAENGLPNIPVTSVYSRFDGVVHQDAAFTRLNGNRKESVEIYSSHIGMGMNAMAGLIIADRLGQTPETWKPFDPADYGLISRLVFPQNQYHHDHQSQDYCN
ncbi:MAG: hypothetical protein AAF204_05580, partial [Pseudomonadota bacterium]